MKKFPLFLCLLAPLTMTSSLHAVTYLFPKSLPVHLKDDAMVKTGAKLYLFHGVTDDLKAIKVHDVLAVYRVTPPDIMAKAPETGKVRILSVLGEHYYQARVIEGAIQPGSLAVKGNVACYVTSFDGSDR